ncbi:hypothetical protein Q7689_00395 [Nocardiopsis tropica]|uniref:hypothetical protein n=1 Tax=Nocardiopsis tropica TaxID=109330 RepID=UPI002E840015|nr:hypothetical protein [Nocardiopsis tropica]
MAEAPYVPCPGDTVRDSDGDIWFVYGTPDNLHAITAGYAPNATPHPIGQVADTWGPLTLAYRASDHDFD